MKNFLILILGTALAAAAFFTRPTQAEFSAFLHGKVQHQSNNAFSRLFGEVNFNQTLQQYTFKDRLLWVAVEKDGKTVYAGAFSYWFTFGAGAGGGVGAMAAPEKTPLPTS